MVQFVIEFHMSVYLHHAIVKCSQSHTGVYMELVFGCDVVYVHGCLVYVCVCIHVSGWSAYVHTVSVAVNRSVFKDFALKGSPQSEEARQSHRGH